MINVNVCVFRLLEQDGVVRFSPSLAETKVCIMECLRVIVESTHNFPRIEKELFPEMKDSNLFLLPVGWHEDHVQNLVKQAMDIFDRNVIGPRRYISLYETYSTLLNGQAEKDKDAFLESTAPLTDFKVMS